MARYGEKQKFVGCITVIRTFRVRRSSLVLDLLTFWLSLRGQWLKFSSCGHSLEMGKQSESNRAGGSTTQIIHSYITNGVFTYRTRHLR